eukprot:128378_1
MQQNIEQQLLVCGYSVEEINTAMRDVGNASDINEIVEFIENQRNGKNADIDSLVNNSDNNHNELKLEIEETKVEHTNPTCICGDLLMMTNVNATIYNGRGVMCDECFKMCAVNSVIYHCVNELNSPYHEAGYDICVNCSNNTNKPKEHRIVVAKCDYVAQQKTYLSFNKNDKIALLQQDEDGWWGFGELLKNKYRGYFVIELINTDFMHINRLCYCNIPLKRFNMKFETDWDCNCCGKIFSPENTIIYGCSSADCIYRKTSDFSFMVCTQCFNSTNKDYSKSCDQYNENDENDENINNFILTKLKSSLELINAHKLQRK